MLTIKKIIIGVVSILLILTISVSLQINQITKRVTNSSVNDVILELDEQLRVYENSSRKEIILDNNNFGSELLKRIKLKSLKRVTGDEGSDILKDAIYYLEYSSGKECFYIDKDGRIFTTKDKGDIRNISVLHWLWWKIDNISDNYTNIYYLSKPDKSVLDFINAEINLVLY